MSVKGTQNYVWFTAERLGRGAMGNVYLARSRKKGTKFAAKVFTLETKAMTRDYITIELEILQYLPRHENVIKFFAVEEETYSKDKVFILELCEAGSLQSILDKPDNYFGLQEEEMLLVFQHIASALEHLHQHKVVHRDVKPGNILLQTTPDGRHVYKLIDFGAARRLDKDDEGFKSLCGTEEYLHPKMHQAAFIKRIPGQVYDHTVDLWSFGVTLYQCATGSLPFVPKDGIRQDKTTMHRLMNDRPPEVISQVQKADGNIEQRTDLPNTCPLTRGARTKVLLFIRHLLNVHVSVEPSTFFSDVREFFLEMKVHVYCLQWRELITVFIKPQHTLIHLHEAIATVTSVPASIQTLLLSDGPLESFISPGETARDFVNTSPKAPIFLSVNSSFVDLKDVWNPFLPAVPNYDNGMDLSSDAKFAREACGIVWYYLHLVQATTLSIQHMYSMEAAYGSTLKTLCQKLELVITWKQSPMLDNLGRMTASLQGRLERAETRHRPACDCLAAAREGYRTVRETLARCKHSHDQLETAYRQHLPHITFRPHSIARILDKPACITSRCEEKALKIVDEAMPLYQVLRADKSKELSHNDLEIHKYSRSELKRCCRRIKEIAEPHCLRELQKIYTDKLDSIKRRTAAKDELIRLDRKAAKCEEDHQKLNEEICKMLESCDLPHSCTDPLPTTSSMDDELKTVPDIDLVEGILSDSAAAVSASRHTSERPTDSGIPKSSMYCSSMMSDLDITPSLHGGESMDPLLGDMSVIEIRSDGHCQVGLVCNNVANGLDNAGYERSFSFHTVGERRDCTDGSGIYRDVVDRREHHVDGTTMADRVDVGERSQLLGRGVVSKPDHSERRDGHVRLPSSESQNSSKTAFLQANLRKLRDELDVAHEQLNHNSRTLKALKEFVDNG